MRRAPKEIVAVELHGMLVEVLHFGKNEGLTQNGGILQIKNAESGEHLFYIQVYLIKYNTNREDDVQDRFITEMGVRDGMVRVKEEEGRVYAIDILKKTVEMVYSPYDKEKKLIKQQEDSQRRHDKQDNF